VLPKRSFDKVVAPSFLELELANLVTIYGELCELGSRLNGSHLSMTVQVVKYSSCNIKLNFKVHFERIIIVLYRSG
jgi:hypothetical protein